MTWAHPAWWRQLHSCVHNFRKAEKWMCGCSCVWKHGRALLGGGCLKWHRWALAKVALQGHVGILCPLYLKEIFCRCFFRFWFLLLFDGSLVSVVKLNCECRILWEWERKQDRALTSNLTWSISERNRGERLDAASTLLKEQCCALLSTSTCDRAQLFSPMAHKFLLAVEFLLHLFHPQHCLTEGCEVPLRQGQMQITSTAS